MDSAGQSNNNAMGLAVSGERNGDGDDDWDMFDDAIPRNGPQAVVADDDQPPEVAAGELGDARQTRIYHRTVRTRSVVLPLIPVVQRAVAVDLAMVRDANESLPAADATSPIVVPDASPARTPNSGSSRKRPRTRSGTPKEAPKKDKSPKVLDESDDDGSTCSICLDSWQMTGEHRLTSLKCGHLFGDSCIRRWFAGMAAGTRCCPSCKSKASLRDLRFIYAKRIGVVDNSEESRLQKLLDAEILRVATLTQDVALVRMDLELQRKYTAHLESQLNQTKMNALNLSSRLNTSEQQNSVNASLASSSARDSSVTGSTVDATAGIIYKLSRECTINICADIGCRVLIHGRRSNTLLVSQKSTQPLFSGFGVRFVDLPTYRPNSFLYMTTKQIRDLAYDQDEQVLVAASMDRTCKLYNTNTRGCLTTFTPPGDKPIWSVEFDRTRSRILYFGTQNGSTFLYDVRQPRSSVDEYRTAGDTSPVISVCAVAPFGVDFPFGGFLVCKLQSLWFYEYTDDQTATPIQLTLPGPFVSMCYREDTNTVLVSTRPRPNLASRLYYMRLVKVEGTTTLLQLAVMDGSSVQAVMSRSAQLRTRDDTAVVATYMQDTKKLQTWRVPNEQQLSQQPGQTSVFQQALAIDDCILDLCPIYGMGGGGAAVQQSAAVYLGALSDTKCRIYKVCEPTG